MGSILPTNSRPSSGLSNPFELVALQRPADPFDGDLVNATAGNSFGGLRLAADSNGKPAVETPTELSPAERFVKEFPEPSEQESARQLIAQVIGPRFKVLPKDSSIFDGTEESFPRPRGDIGDEPLTRLLEKSRPKVDFRSVNETPLLTRKEEIDLFREYNLCKWRARQIGIRCDPQFPPKEAVHGLADWLGKSLEFRDKIWSANLRLPLRFAKRQFPTDKDKFLEAAQDGFLNLASAINGFDWTRGTKFGTYASEALKNGRNSTHNRETKKRLPMDRAGPPIGELPSKDVGVLRELEKSEAKERLAKILLEAKLDKRELKVIANHFELDGRTKMTLEQLGKELGITKERVRQIESRAKDKLRKAAT